MKIKYAAYCLFTALLLTGFYNGYSQNLENLDEEQLFTVSGGIRINHVIYTGWGMEQRRDPYQYIFSANLNMKFLLWEMPLSFTYTNKKGKLQHSLNQLSLRPTYKWLTLHLGKSSMTFSPYTMNGRLFEGVGAEIQPKGRFEGSVFYGRIQKVVATDTTKDSVTEPVYKRMACGTKCAYKPDAGIIEAIVFHSADDTESLPIGETNLPMAEKNTVGSLRAEQKILGVIKVQAEYAYSNLSFYFPGFDASIPGYSQKKDEQHQAVNGNIDYLGETFTVGIGYERVDPGYRTHGAYYFNNDLENVTLQINTALFNKKMQISANSGIQRDNLDETKMSRMNRFVGSAQVSLQPAENCNASLSYSNFRSYTRMWKSYEDYQLIHHYDEIDTLNYMQISQNVALNANIRLGKKEDFQHLFSAFGNLQISDNSQGNQNKTNSIFLNASALYNCQYNPIGISFSPGFSGYGSNISDMQSLTFGPVATVTKVDKKKKWRTSLSFNYNHTYVEDKLLNRISVCRLVSRYTLNKKHRFSLLLTQLFKNMPDNSEKNIEMSMTFNYGYSF